MKFEVTLVLNVDPDAPFFDSTGFHSQGLQEQLDEVLYDQDDIEVEEIEVIKID